MNEKQETPPDDFTMFYIFGGLAAAAIIGGFIVTNLGWIAFAWFAASVLTAAWMAAVIGLLWSINRKLDLLRKEKQDGEA